MRDKLYVWDPLIRIFHWTLVLAFTFAYFSGDEENVWHVYSGYLILGLLAFRLIWGFIGSRYARFSSFRFAPSAVFAYLGSLFGKGQTEDYIGHNPAGSWMVIMLIASLGLTGFSGLKVYGAEGHGPLAQQAQTVAIRLIGTAQADDDRDRHETGEHEDEEGEEFWEEIHEFFANLTVVLVLLHIGGVALSSRKHGENLVRAMITGYKGKHG